MGRALKIQKYSTNSGVGVPGAAVGIDLGFPNFGSLTDPVYNSAGTLVETLAGTINYSALGYVSATITSTTTISAGRYSIVAEVTDVTTVKYGGLQLLVKGL